MPLETFFTASEQMMLFLWSVVIGAGLGVGYRLFRIVRLTFPHGSVAVFFEDVLFSLIWGFVMFVFVMEFGRGNLRFFYIIGNAVGFILYLVTLGNIVNRIMRGIIGALKKIVSFIFRTLVLPVNRFFVALYLMLKPIFCNLYLKLMKMLPKTKKSLKTADKMLYNNRIRKKRSADLSKKDVKEFGKRKNKKTRNAFR